MKDDTEDYPVSYLLYVSCALVAIALVAAVAFVFLFSFSLARPRLDSRSPATSLPAIWRAPLEKTWSSSDTVDASDNDDN